MRGIEVGQEPHTLKEIIEHQSLERSQKEGIPLAGALDAVIGDLGKRLGYSAEQIFLACVRDIRIPGFQERMEKFFRDGAALLVKTDMEQRQKASQEELPPEALEEMGKTWNP